jgi:hypothetical protein
MRKGSGALWLSGAAVFNTELVAERIGDSVKIACDIGVGGIVLVE